MSSGVQHPGGGSPPPQQQVHAQHAHGGYPYPHFPPHGYMDPHQHPHMAPPPIPWYHFPPPPPMPPPPKPLPPLLEGESTIGIMIWPSDNGKLVVTGVKEDKSAGQSELQVGDIVAKIDGLDVHGMDASEVATKLIGQSGSTVSIVTEKGVTVNLIRDVSAEEANKKVDRRYGKRSPEARAAVSAGMRTKQSVRRDKDKRISLGDRLLVAQRLENKVAFDLSFNFALSCRSPPPPFKAPSQTMLLACLLSLVLSSRVLLTHDIGARAGDYSEGGAGNARVLQVLHFADDEGTFFMANITLFLF